MLTYYKTDKSGTLVQLDAPEKGCWISVVSPTRGERRILEYDIGIVPEFIKASLDEEETSYIDQNEEERQVMVIADYPVRDRQDPELSFNTLPIGVILTPDYVVTICSEPNRIISDMEKGRGKFSTTQKTRFLLLIFLNISQRFLFCLRQIDRFANQTEKRLYKHMENKELLSMLKLDKSLIYFSTSLKADELTLNKIMRGKQIPLYPDDTDLLEDVIIEIRQAVEMCEVYSNINARTMDGFSNVLSNNMNMIMKELTVLTIVMSIPNMIYGFYGMNVTGLPLPVMWFPLVLSIVICVLAWIYFKHTHLFK